jgi:hypothetical protein
VGAHGVNVAEEALDRIVEEDRAPAAGAEEAVDGARLERLPVTWPSSWSSQRLGQSASVVPPMLPRL